MATRTILQTFHRYHLLAPLLRKAGHETYLASLLTAPEQHVVLKVFDAACAVAGAIPDDFRQLEMRLQNVNHPHLVPVLELGIEQGRPYIVSEYQRGGSLRQYLGQRSSGHLSLEEAAGVVMQVGQGLALAHTHGMRHQGICPENILLNEQGQARLADFRLTSLIREPAEKISSDHRLRGYQAPEQLSGIARPASDQYALGYLLYELLTGIAPDPTVLRQHATLPSLVASTTLPFLPHRLEAVILRTLAVKPHERYPDVLTFLAELQLAIRSSLWPSKIMH